MTKNKYPEIRKPRGYWNNWDNLKSELEKIIKKNNGELPSTIKLCQLGRSDLVHASKKHGGMSKVRQILNCNYLRKEKGYYKDYKIVKKVLKEIIDSLGRFPSQTELRSLKQTGLTAGIVRYHNGLYEIAKKMGYESEAKPQSYWKDPQNFKKELEVIWQNHPELKRNIPSTWWLDKNNYSYLKSAIHSNYTGISQFRKNMGQESQSEYTRRFTLYKDKDKVKKAIKEIWNNYPNTKGKLPSGNWMKNNGLNELCNAIDKYHGGPVSLRKELKLEYHKGQHKYKREALKDWDFFRIEIESIIKDNADLNGQFPRTSWLNRNGYYPIYNAIIKYHGGMSSAENKYANSTQLLESLLENYING